MTSDQYQLLTAIAGGLLPAFFTLLTELVKRRKPRVPKVEAGDQVNQNPTRPRNLKFVGILCLVCVGIGFAVGAMTKANPSVIRTLYNQREQILVSGKKIDEINVKISELKKQETTELSEPGLTDAQKKAINIRYKGKAKKLETSKKTFESIRNRPRSR